MANLQINDSGELAQVQSWVDRTQKDMNEPARTAFSQVCDSETMGGWVKRYLTPNDRKRLANNLRQYRHRTGNKKLTLDANTHKALAEHANTLGYSLPEAIAYLLQQKQGIQERLDPWQTLDHCPKPSSDTYSDQSKHVVVTADGRRHFARFTTDGWTIEGNPDSSPVAWVNLGLHPRIDTCETCEKEQLLYWQHWDNYNSSQWICDPCFSKVRTVS